MIPDIIIIVGALALLVFVVRALLHLKPATAADGAAVEIPAGAQVAL